MTRAGLRTFLVVCLIFAFFGWLAWNRLAGYQAKRIDSMTSPPAARPEVSSSPAAPTAAPVPEVQSTAPTAAKPADSPSTVFGHVFTEEPLHGAPGVTVALMERRADESTARIASAVTDGNGRFQLAGLVAGKNYGLMPSVTTGYANPQSEWFTLDSAASRLPHVFFWHPEGATVSGTLCDVTVDYSQIDFDRVVRVLLAPETASDADLAYVRGTAGVTALPDVGRLTVKGLGPRPAPNVTIVLRGESLSRQAVTGPEGQFEFTGLPFGEYEVSADAPLWMLPAGVERMELVRQRVVVADGQVKLGLTYRTDLITVSGRVTDPYGRPVAGAKVTTTFDPPVDQWGQEIEGAWPSHVKWVESHTRMAVTDAEGRYQLQGLEPEDNINELAGHLGGGAGRRLRRVGVHVEDDGFVQRKESMPKVLLVTQAELDAAHRFMRAISQAAQKAGQPGFQEKEGVLLPVSKGNAIPDIDVTLDYSQGGGQ